MNRLTFNARILLSLSLSLLSLFIAKFSEARPPQHITLASVNNKEGNIGITTFTFELKLSVPAGPEDVYNIKTSDGTAAAMYNDYVPVDLCITVPAGSTTYTFNVSVKGDLLLEPDEFFFVEVKALLDPSVRVFESGTIINDDFTVELIGLEATQVVQDWKNSINLIEHRIHTIVRAHIQSKDATTIPYQAKLRAYRNGVELPDSPWPPQNGGTFMAPSYIGPPYTTNNDAFNQRRNDINSSLNFEIPDAWMSGDVELEIQGAIECKEPDDSPNDCKTTVTFKPSRPLEIKFFPIEGFSSDGRVLTKPSADALARIRSFIYATFPVNSINESYEQPLCIDARKMPKYNINDQVAIKLWEIKKLTGGKSPSGGVETDKYYVGLVDDPLKSSGGSTLVPTTERKSSAAYISRLSSAAHEVGHAIGLGHVIGCRNPLEPFESFPYSTNIEASGKPTIGPMNSGYDRLIYGYNSSINTSGDVSNSIISPFEHFELMSYCFDPEPRWPSDFTYSERLYNLINPAPVQKIVKQAVSQTLSVQAATGYRVFRGTLNFTNNEASFLPSLFVEIFTEPVSPTVGEYQLQLFDDKNNIIKTIYFEPDKFTDDNELGYFSLAAPYDLPVKKAVVLKNSVAIGQIVSSNHTPTVKVLFPNGGESVKGSTSITWEASDEDGDQLTYIIEFSKDGGVTWKTLDLDIYDKTYKVNADRLGMTEKGLFRVMASDGFNIGMDISDNTFSTPNSKPLSFISSPSDGGIYVGGAPIFFQGFARDVEDGNLAATSLSWYSNLDGFLGDGENLYKFATSLKEGNHVITLTATDKAGASVSKSVKIKVQRVFSPSSSPTISCPADIALASESAKCTASVSLAATADGIPTPSITYKIGTTIITSPYNFPVGTTTVNNTASNGIMPDATCSFKVTVSDKEKPVLICPTIPTLCYNATGIYTISAVKASDNCGIKTYAYVISGATSRKGTSGDASGTFNPGTSIIEWTVTDVNGNISTCQATVVVNRPIIASIANVQVLPQGVDINTVYMGYAPAASATLNVQANGGSGNLTYKWSNGGTSASTVVKPTTSILYSVSVSDGLGCTTTATKQIRVVDVRCGNNLNKIQVCKVPPGNSNNAKTKCIAASAVPAHLATGSYLGVCK